MDWKINIILINRCECVNISILKSNKAPRPDQKKYYIIPTKIKNNKVNLINIIWGESELPK